MRKLFAIILVCTLVAGLAVGCKPVATKPTEQVVNLGCVLPMTGGSATFGTSSKNGVTMAVEEFNAAGGATINGVKTTVNMVVEDDTGSPEVGASAAQKLINQDKVIGIIGAIMSKVSLAVGPIAQAAGVPEISPTSTNEKVTLVGDYIFRACFIDSFQGTVMANYAWNTLKVKTAACLFDNGNDYPKGLAENFRKSFEALGGKVVAYEAFTDEDKTVDFKAQLTKIKAAKPFGLLRIDRAHPETGPRDGSERSRRRWRWLGLTRPRQDRWRSCRRRRLLQSLLQRRSRSQGPGVR
jgi:branched-chain amino acid transport system substrate-binding protein